MPKDPQSTIQCMFGLRFLSMVWTLIGHSFIFVQAYLDNVDEYKADLVDNFWNQWITNFTLSVDVFLTLSGTLTAYSWFKKWQKNTTGKKVQNVPKKVSQFGNFGDILRQLVPDELGGIHRAAFDGIEVHDYYYELLLMSSSIIASSTFSA